MFLLFDLCLARLLTLPGALVVDLGLFWLLLRFIVRLLAFPGSFKWWRRNIEALYRVELSKQVSCHLGQLCGFLLIVSQKSNVPRSDLSWEGVKLGLLRVESLARNFQIQQRDKVRFTKEQTRAWLLVQGVERWLADAKAIEKRNGNIVVQVPLMEWIERACHLGPGLSVPRLASSSEVEAGTCIEKLEQLIILFDELQLAQGSIWANVRCFLRSPTVGSLHYFRAELQVKYAGQHCWIKTSGGRQIDAMFISSKGASAGPEDKLPPERMEPDKEEIPLRHMEEGSALGPVIVWCNANASYYEMMAFESHWVDFYLGHGCAILLFNYGGYGRSQGKPSPGTLASDANAVVNFLKRRGFTQIGVHGRSIGGIAACSLMQEHSDVVKMLIADRTLSTLTGMAKHMFGGWAVNGLNMSAMRANNLTGYAKATCYKLLICDPRDVTIPETASLRSAVAAEALEHVSEDDRLAINPEHAKRIADAWAFLETCVCICDRAGWDGNGAEFAKSQGASSPEPKRSARQPVIGKPLGDVDGPIDEPEEDTQRLVGSTKPSKSRKQLLDVQWLEENMQMVQTTLGPHAESIRSSLETVSAEFNSSGTTLDEALSRAPDGSCEAIKCFVNNLQVWGSLGTVAHQLQPCAGADKAIERFLHRDALPQDGKYEALLQLGQTTASLTPEGLAAYHRRLARIHAAKVHREFQQQVKNLQRVLEPIGTSERHPGAQVRSAVISHLLTVEDFLKSIYHFFKCVDMSRSKESTACEDSEESGSSHKHPLRPSFDRALTGYLMCIDCGHNGIPNEGEAQHLALHLRAAGFSRTTTGSAT